MKQISLLISEIKFRKQICDFVFSLLHISWSMLKTFYKNKYLF